MELLAPLSAPFFALVAASQSFVSNAKLNFQFLDVWYRFSVRFFLHSGHFTYFPLSGFFLFDSPTAQRNFQSLVSR